MRLCLWNFLERTPRWLNLHLKHLFSQASGILVLIASLLVPGGLPFTGPLKIGFYIYMSEKIKPFYQLLRYLGNQTGIFETTEYTVNLEFSHYSSLLIGTYSLSSSCSYSTHRTAIATEKSIAKEGLYFSHAHSHYSLSPKIASFRKEHTGKFNIFQQCLPCTEVGKAEAERTLCHAISHQPSSSPNINQLQ